MGGIPLKRVFILLILIVAACSPVKKSTATTGASSTTAGTAVSGQASATPALAQSTAGPTVTPNQTVEISWGVTPADTPAASAISSATSSATSSAPPALKISDQAVGAGTVMVDEVISRGPGWVVIYTTKASGQPDQPIGHAPVKDGENTRVMVPVDPNQAKGTLYAQLHADHGVVGAFEFPGPDQPVMVGTQMIGSAFKTLDAQAAKGAPAQVVINLGSQPATQSVLVDGNGMSLYASIRDTPGKSSCDAQCQATWRPLLATGRIITGSGVNLKNTGVILLPNCSRQVTYLGAPLYLFTQDQKPGDVNGQGYDGAWYLVLP